MIYHLLPWYRRPLSCLLGFHEFLPLPFGIGYEFCDGCGGERRVTR